MPRDRLLRNIGIGIDRFRRRLDLAQLLRLGRIVGDWRFVSLSSHNSRYLGTCNFTYQDGHMVGTGTFIAENRPIGQWASLAIATDGNRLIIVYEMTEIREGESKRIRGVNEVNFGSDRSTPMGGTWTTLGVTNNAGTITYTRPATKAA